MMKTNLFFTFCIVIKTFSLAQIPPIAFNYSSVAYTASGQPIANAPVGVNFVILKGSTTGSVQYSENHFVNTNSYGLFNLIIGSGAVNNGSLSTIDWGIDNYYLKVGLDVNGGTNFILNGIFQFLSVPYSLHAKFAERLVERGEGGGIFNHFIGEAFGGGIIFHLWKDNIGGEHGLIVDIAELGGSQAWSNIIQPIGKSAQSPWDGKNNTNAIIGQSGHTSSAASLCANSTNNGQNDWYLPSIDEWILLGKNRFSVNKALSSIGGGELLKYSQVYWSSTEDISSGGALYFAHINGTGSTHLKSNKYWVRAIRAF